MFNNRINPRILLALIVGVLIYHSAYGLTINGLIYDVDAEQGTAICTGGTSNTSLVIPKTIPHPSGRDINVVGISPYAFQNNSSIYGLIINANLSYIGASAFKNCRNLELIEVNGDIIQCGNSAFAKCSSLSQINFPYDNISIGDSCFYECKQLKTIALSHRTKTIGKHSFSNCSLLSNISLGDSIQSIDNYAFSECNLTSLEFPKTVELIGESAFKNAFYISTPSAYPNTYEISIPNTVRKIGANAFDGNPIASIIFEYGELPIELETTSFTEYPDFSQRKFFETTLFIGRPITNKNEPFRKSKFVRKLHIACSQVKDYQFEGCENLTSLSFSDCVKSIGRSAFANCQKLTYQLNLKGVETIGEYAFYGCGRIIDLDFYEGLNSIGEYAFAHCDSIPYIRIPPHLKNIPQNCFAYTAGHSVEFLSSTDTLEVFSLPRSIENVEINRPLTSRSSRAVGQMLTLESLSCGGTITSISNQAFYNCQASSVRLSEGIESIGDEAFASSRNLRRIYLPNSIKSIGAEAFSNCIGLREIELGDSLKSIGKHCFESNSWISSIKCTSSVPPVVDGEDVFSDKVYENAQLIVNYPSGVLYKEALGWRKFLNIKEPIPEIDSIRISHKYIETECEKGFFLSCKVYPYYLGCEDNIKWRLRGYSDLKLDKQDDGTVYVSCLRFTENEYVICEHVTSEDSHAYLADTCFVKVSRPNLTSINLNGESEIVAGVRNKMELDYEHEHFVPSEYVKFTVTNLTPDIITLEGEWPKKNEFDVTAYDQFEFFVYGRKSGIGKIKIADSYNPDNCIIEEIECVPNITSLSFNETELSIDIEDDTKLDYDYKYSLKKDGLSLDDLISLEYGEGIHARKWGNGVLLVTGHKPGIWNIKLYSNDGSNLSTSCLVTVRVPKVLVSSISLTPTSAEGYEGGQIPITATILPEDATNMVMEWKSSDETVATVDDNGLVSLLKEGTATITASATDESGVAATCNLTVIKPAKLVSSISLNPTSADGKEGEQIQITATVLPEDATNKVIRWSSSDESVAIVDCYGMVSLLKEGTATITASATDESGVAATCNLTVIKPAILVSSISLDPLSAKGTEGDQIQITATVLPEDATNKVIRWSSSDENIASVDDSGLIYLLKKGTAVITASATDESGVSADCAIVVSEASGIEEVLADKSAYVKIFNLNGILIFEGEYADARLTPNYYIVVCDGKNIKVKVQ